jgi:hypothetical protein
MYELIKNNENNFMEVYFYLDKHFIPFPIIDHDYNNYNNIFCELLKLEPIITDSRLIFYVVEEEEPYSSYNTCSYALSDSTEMYCVGFEKWESLLGMDIENDSFDFRTGAELIAIFLWEITFYGFTQDRINEQLEKLKERIRQLESGQCKTIPFDQILEELNLKIDDLE